MLRCLRCHRPIPSHATVVHGMGRRCYWRWKAEGNEMDKGTLRSIGLVCMRRHDGTAWANVEHKVVYHSPTGFEWGYPGSGPAELALNVLHELIPPRADQPSTTIAGVTVHADAERLHQDFKCDFIEPIKRAGGTIPIKEMLQWIESRRRAQ